MLHVILHILAIIGIILLCILGLLLLLILLVLFVPIRYRVNGRKYGNDIDLAVKVTYLLHMLSAKFNYPEKGSIIVRLFGIKIYDSGKLFGKDEPDGKEEQSDKVAATPTDDEDMDSSQEPHIEEDTESSEEAYAEENAVPSEEAHAEENAVPSEGTLADKYSGHTENPHSSDKKGEKKSIFAKIKYTIHAICDKIKHIGDTIKKLSDNISYYKSILTDEKNKQFYGRVWDRILRVLKSIRPRVLKANLHLGTGSPDTTGYLCGVYGMLLPVLGEHVHMEADFEEAVWEGDVYAKGRITVFTILLQAGKILLDKQLRILIKELKRED